MQIFNPETDTIKNIRFLKQKNLEGEQLIQKGLYRETIIQNGIDVTYFRKELDFYHDGGGIDANHIYGESPNAKYKHSEDIIVFMTITADNALLQTFGIETSVTAEIFMMKEDFVEAFRDKVGKELSVDISVPVSVTVRNYEGTLEANFTSDKLKGSIELSMDQYFNGDESGEQTIPVTVAPFRTAEPHNHMLAVSTAYTEREITGEFAGDLTGTLSPLGSGILTGTLSATLSYFSEDDSDNKTDFWGIAPQVGDFIRFIEFGHNDGNFEEYEITQINDKDLASSGLNPLLDKYLWRCNIVRRTPSHEDIAVRAEDENGNPLGEDSDPTYVDFPEEEKYTQNNTELHELLQNEESDNVFEYTENDVDKIDKKESDDVYGGF
jgi:hypothetical protein